MGPDYETIASRRVFSGRIFDVYVDRIALASGDQATREVVRHPGAVGIVALFEDSFLMVRQTRHATGGDLLEIPAGKLDRKGESAQQCARRELEEETGFTCSSVELLAEFFTTPGFCDEWFHLFWASGLEQVAEGPRQDHQEPLSLQRVPAQQALDRVASGEIADAKTIIGILLGLRKLEAGVE